MFLPSDEDDYGRLGVTSPFRQFGRITYATGATTSHLIYHRVLQDLGTEKHLYHLTEWLFLKNLHVKDRYWFFDHVFLCLCIVKVLKILFFTKILMAFHCAKRRCFITSHKCVSNCNVFMYRNGCHVLTNNFAYIMCNRHNIWLIKNVHTVTRINSLF